MRTPHALHGGGACRSRLLPPSRCSGLDTLLRWPLGQPGLHFGRLVRVRQRAGVRLRPTYGFFGLQAKPSLRTPTRSGSRRRACLPPALGGRLATMNAFACGAGWRPASSSTLRTEVAETVMPRPLSSPTIRLYPQCAFSLARRRISSRSERSSPGRPGLRCEYVHRRAISRRCQRSSVFGRSPTPSSDAAAPAATPGRTGSGHRDTRTTRASSVPRP